MEIVLRIKWTSFYASFDAERKATTTATQVLYRDYAGAPGYQGCTRNSRDARGS